MKKFLVLMLALALVFTFAACNTPSNDGNDTPTETPENTPAAPKDDPTVKSEGVMTHAEYIAADLEAAVVIEAYVQAKQSWYKEQCTVYLADPDGAYLAYNMACSEADYAKLVKGAKIRVTGYKAEWSGEVEIGAGATFELLEGNYVAPIFDATSLLANTEELLKHQNEFVSFKGLTVAPSKDKDGKDVAFLYNWDGSGAAGSDSDLYFNVSLGDQTFQFVVEYYVCDANGVYGAETDVYKAVQNLKIGDVIDLEGFLYWYNGANPHITSVKTVG